MTEHNKYYIRLNDNQFIVVWCENTRNGFRHLAELWENHALSHKAKKVYINRTWERFTYESVLRQLLADSRLHDLEATLNQVSHLDDFKMKVEQ